MKRNTIKEFVKSLPKEAQEAFSELRCDFDRPEWRVRMKLPFRVETIMPFISSLLFTITLDAGEEDELGGDEEELRYDYESTLHYRQADLQKSWDLRANPEVHASSLATLREILGDDEAKIAEVLAMSDRALQRKEDELIAFTFEAFCEEQRERQHYLRERTQRYHIALRQIEAALASRAINVTLDRPLTFWESLEAAGVAVDNGDGTVTFFDQDAAEC